MTRITPDPNEGWVIHRPTKEYTPTHGLRTLSVNLRCPQRHHVAVAPDRWHAANQISCSRCGATYRRR